MRPCLFVFVLGSLAVPVHGLTLLEAKEEARSQSPAVEAYRKAEEASRAARNAVKGTWLPKAELRHVYTRLDDDTVERSNALLPFLAGFDPGPMPGPVLDLDEFRVFGESHRTEVAVEWALWAGGARLGAGRAAGSAHAIAAADVDAAVRNIDTEVGTIFLGAWAAVEIEAVASAAVERAERYLAQASRKKDLGSATELDVLRWEVELESARASLANALAEREATRFSLGALLGRALGPEESLEVPDPRRDIPGSSVVDDWAGDDAAFDAWCRMARARILQDHPAMVAARAATQGASAGVTLATAPLLPSLAVVGTWGHQANATYGLDGYEEWNASMVLSLPLLPFVEGYQGRREAQALEAASFHRRDDLRSRLLAGFDGLARRTRASAVSLLHQERAWALTQRRSEAVDRAVSAGHATDLDLADSEVMRRSQAVVRVQARLEHWVHVLELGAWVGPAAWDGNSLQVGAQR